MSLWLVYTTLKKIFMAEVTQSSNCCFIAVNKTILTSMSVKQDHPKSEIGDSWFLFRFNSSTIMKNDLIYITCQMNIPRGKQNSSNARTCVFS